jgi:hypothetical protein
MTQAAAKRRLTHYLAVTTGIPHRDAAFALQNMTSKERGILGQKALKWRQDHNKDSNQMKDVKP